MVDASTEAIKEEWLLPRTKQMSDWLHGLFILEDYVAIILAAAQLDDQLQTLLVLEMGGHSTTAAELFEDRGCCSSFSAKIQLAAALGCIHADVRRDLDILRRMRNKAAHSATAVSFDTQSMRDAALSLRPGTMRLVAADIPRFAFLAAVHDLSTILVAEQFKRKAIPFPRPPCTAPDKLDVFLRDRREYMREICLACGLAPESLPW